MVLGGALPLLLLLLLRLEGGKCQAGSRAAGGLACSKEATSALQVQPCYVGRLLSHSMRGMYPNLL